MYAIDTMGVRKKLDYFAQPLFQSMTFPHPEAGKHDKGKENKFCDPGRAGNGSLGAKTFALWKCPAAEALVKPGANEMRVHSFSNYPHHAPKLSKNRLAESLEE